MLWIVLAIFLVYAIPTTVSLSKSKKKLEAIQQEQTALAKEREQLQDEVKNLKTQLDTVDSDEFIRKYAHENLGMVLPDELVVKLKDGGLGVDKDKYKEASSIAEEAAKRAEEEAAKEGESQSEDQADQSKSKEAASEASSEAKGSTEKASTEKASSEKTSTEKSSGGA